MKRKLYVAVIIILLIFGTLEIVSSESLEWRDFSIGNQDAKEDVRGMIKIENNSALKEFANEHGLDGNGTIEEPYRLVNYTIDGLGQEYGLYLSTTDLHFVVEHSEIYNTSQAGIGLFQVSNFTLKNTSIRSNETGLWVDDSSKNRILGNYFSGLQEVGIKIRGSSPNNVFSNNSFEGCGISLRGDEETVRSQNISGNTISGDPIYYFKNGHMEKVTGEVGQIIIANVNGSGSSEIDIESTVIEDGSLGITIADSYNISLRNVKIENQTQKGIYISNSEKVKIEDSKIRKNGAEGIYLLYSDQISIKNNELSLNQGGIYSYSSNNCNFTGNKIRDNRERGIELTTPNIQMDSDGDPPPNSNNTISRNLIEGSVGYAIYITGNSFENKIFLNSIVSNRREKNFQLSSVDSQAYEEIANDSLSNHWNSQEGLGNYWGNWSGVDENRDGIIDDPYPIEGSESQDSHPLSSTIGPPGNIRVRPRNGAVRLNWSEPRYSIFEPVEKIKLYKGTEKDNCSLHAGLNSTTDGFLDENVTNGKEYYYHLSASNEMNESVLTDPVKAVPDGTPPTLVDYLPRGGNVSLNTTIEVEFSEKMDKESVDISIEGITGNITGDGKFYRFEPSGNLSYGTTYHVNVTGKDRAGNPLENGTASWSFSTPNTATISGRIIGEDGDPIVGVYINPDRGTKNTTGPDGRFEIQVPPGSRTIHISKPGYVEEEINIEVEPGQTKKTGEMDLQKEEMGGEGSTWFWPLIVIASGMFVLGVIAAVTFMWGWRKREKADEKEIYEGEDYEDVSQEEFESWWEDERD
ncbi:MAG: right-handed parallel beta-helix repeat-containing protein [Candidatus Thermoplasmatota archaeon]|nr:right-handed parallel beta-helix repeat-containing protein [Candidatus Thermoplasmatota archaeon]